MPFEYDVNEMRKELAGLADKRYRYNRVEFTDEQIALIMEARDVHNVDWKTLVKWWASKGWQGSENTLRKAYREAKEKEQ